MNWLLRLCGGSRGAFKTTRPCRGQSNYKPSLDVLESRVVPAGSLTGRFTAVPAAADACDKAEVVRILSAIVAGGRLNRAANNIQIPPGPGQQVVVELLGAPPAKNKPRPVLFRGTVDQLPEAQVGFQAAGVFAFAGNVVFAALGAQRGQATALVVQACGNTRQQKGLDPLTTQTQLKVAKAALNAYDGVYAGNYQGRACLAGTSFCENQNGNVHFSIKNGVVSVHEPARVTGKLNRGLSAAFIAMVDGVRVRFGGSVVAANGSASFANGNWTVIDPDFTGFGTWTAFLVRDTGGVG